MTRRPNARWPRKPKTQPHEHDIYVASPEVPYPPLAVRWINKDDLSKEPRLRYFSWRYGLVRYIERGRGVFRAGGKSWPVEAGAVCWGQPGTELVLETDRAEPLAGPVLIFAGEEVSRAFGRYLHEPVGAAKLVDGHGVARVIEEIFAEARAGREHMAQNCLELARVLLRRIDACMVGWPKEHTRAGETYRRCREYIDTHYATIRTLSEVADACRVGVPRLCVLFQEHHDVSPYQYITHLKLNKAERLLLGPKMPISQIAREVGYDNSRVFSRKFKAVYGRSPTAYRKRPGWGL